MHVFRSDRNIFLWAVSLIGVLALSAPAQVFTSSPGSSIDSANPTTSDAIVVSGGPASIASIRIELNITHSWDSDMDIFLTPPGGTPIELSTDNAGSGDNYTMTNFTGSADPNFSATGGDIGLLTAATDAPLTGTFTPEDLAGFDALYGTAADGTWTLEVTDDTGGDTGTLDSWTIEFAAVTQNIFTSSPGAALDSALSPAMDTINVAGGPTTIDSIRIELNFTHSWDSDLDVFVTPPGGTPIELSTDNAGSGDNYTMTNLTGSADPVFTASGGDIGLLTAASDAPLTGFFTPEDLAGFDALYGTDPTGDWILVVTDDTGGDTGTLDSWTIEFGVLGSNNYTITADASPSGHAAGTSDAVIMAMTASALNSATINDLTLTYTGSGGSAVTNVRVVEDLGTVGTYEAGTDNVLATGAAFSSATQAFDLSPDQEISPSANLLVIADLTGSASGAISIESDTDVSASSSPSGTQSFPVTGTSFAVFEVAVVGVNGSFVQDFESGTLVNYSAFTASGGSYPQATSSSSLILGADGTNTRETRVSFSDANHPQGHTTQDPTSGVLQASLDMPGNASPTQAAALDFFYDLSALDPALDQVTFAFKWADQGSEDHDGDIVVISRDGGATWEAVVFNFPTTRTPDDAYFYARVDLSAAVTALGGTFGSTFVVRIQEEDDFDIALDGTSLDDVSLIASDGTGTPSADVREDERLGASVADDGTFDFGQIGSGTVGPQVFVITNTGQEPLIIPSAPVLAGAQAGDYSLVNPTTVTYPETIYVGGCATFEVTFAPTGIGVKNADVTFSHNGTGSPYTVNLLGEEVATTLLIEVTDGTTPYSNGGAVADFGSVGVFDGNSTVQTVTVNNTGTGSIDVLAPVLSGLDALDFILDLSNFPTDVSGVATTATVGAAGSITFDVYFNPTVAGASTASIDIGHTATNETDPFTLNLSGTATAPLGTAIFEDDPAGVISDAADLIVTQNVSGIPTTVHSFTIEIVASHTFVGDVTFSLTPPGGNPIDLVAQQGTGLNDFLHMALTGVADPERDAGSTLPSVTTGDGPFTGLFTVEDNATFQTEFTGLDPNGTWTLTVNDGFIGDDGVLESWTLQFQEASMLTTIASYDFEGDTPSAVSNDPDLTAGDFMILQGSQSFPAGNGSTDAVSTNTWDGALGAQAHTVTLTPMAGQEITLGQVTFDNQASGTGPDMFSVRVLDNGTDTGFDPGLSATVTSFATNTVVFTGAANGPFSGPVTIQFVANGASSSAGTWRLDNVDIEGSVDAAAGAPVIGVSRSGQINDGDADAVGSVDVSGANFSYTIDNSTGTAALTIDAVSFSAANNVSASTVTSIPLTVNAGSTGTLEITVDPAVDGSFDIEMDIENNTSGATDPFDIMITGTGTGGVPTIAVELSSTPLADDSFIDVGNVDVGGQTFSYDVTNSGTGDLTITAVNFVGMDNSSPSVVTSLPLTIGVGSTGSLDINFDPDCDGTFTVDFDIINNSAANTDVYTIDHDGTGTGGVQALDVTDGTSSIAAGGTDAQGTQAIGTPLTLTYTIDNSAGTTDLNVTGTTIDVTTETNVSSVSVSSGGGAQTVACGATATFDVTYTVDTAAAFDFDFVVESDDPTNASYRVTVSGTGSTSQVNPEINVVDSGSSPIADGGSDPQGTVNVGVTQSVSYTIQNTGNGDLTVSGVTFANLVNVTTPTLSTSPSGTITAGNSSSFTVQYAVGAVNPYSFDVVIANDDADEGSYTITVTGTGQAVAGQPALGVTGATNFSAPSTTSPITAIWTVTNVGTGTLTVSSLTLSGSSTFTLSGLSFPLNLNSGQSQSFSITFTPTATGTVTAVATVDSNSGGTQTITSINLSGNIATQVQGNKSSSKSCSVVTDASESQGLIGLFFLGALAYLRLRRKHLVVAEA